MISSVPAPGREELPGPVRRVTLYRLVVKPITGGGRGQFGDQGEPCGDIGKGMK